MKAEPCARLVSVLASTVFDGSNYFWIFTGMLSLALSLGFQGSRVSGLEVILGETKNLKQLRNVMNRQGWSRFLVTKTLTCLGLRPRFVLGCTAPTAISRLHDVAKISCGYPRMIAPIVLGLVQLVTGHGLFRSTNTVVALAVIFVFEVLEDVFHHWELLPFAPVPQAAAEYFSSLDAYSPYQSTVPLTQWSSVTGPVLPEPCDWERRVSNGSVSSTPEHSPLGDSPVNVSPGVSPKRSVKSDGSEFSGPSRRRRPSVSSAVSTGGVETGFSGVVRRWWGQDLKVHTALRLWHLRSWLAPQVPRHVLSRVTAARL